MVAYQDFVALCRSGDSEDRGRAAHLAAMAYLAHTGPADEHAALYAALVGFLDDPSVKVRAALAYGLLHAPEAPRPILLALLQDSPVISRAVAQYSPALIDTDLLALLRGGDEAMLIAVSERARLSRRVAEAVIAAGNRDVILALLLRSDLSLSEAVLARLAAELGVHDATLRGALLRRSDLPATARLLLVDAVADELRQARIVRGAVMPARLERLLRDASDSAAAQIGESASCHGERHYVEALVGEGRVSARLILHAMVNGQVLFAADCIGSLAEVPRDKVFTLLESGSRPALNALLARCGLTPGLCNMICRLVLHARAADLADDIAARHYVVTALTEELIAEHEGAIPPELDEAFDYLSHQNIALARRAARGVMSAFAESSGAQMDVPPAFEPGQPLALPAA